MFGEPGGARSKPGGPAHRSAKRAASSGGPPPSAPPSAPLAARLRPRSLDDLVGQQHLLAPGSVLRGLIEEDRLRSVLLYGPPGTGKTSIAHVIALATSAHFEQLSAVTSGVADVRRIMEEARERQAGTGRRTILFIDEVHRFSRTQQDALLPGVEAGWVVFIGATTENPFFSITSPLLSRSLLFRLEPLERSDVVAILERAVAHDEHGLGGRFTVAPEVLDHLAGKAEGDARVALNGLDAAVELAASRGETVVSLADVEEALRQRLVRYDRAGDQHYDVISAFIKAMRGSDPDAALAWLARMIHSGEDPRFIARRMVIFASEDVGMADTQALVVATAAAQAVEYVGLPEVQLNLAHAAVYLATAPKSNAVIRGIGAAMADVEKEGQGAVPSHLRDAHYPGAKALGHGAGYKYPHDFPGAAVEQSHMPEGFEDKTYWEPEDR
ncbi:MAG: replication-associated recombination protein A [Actinobacteria bacterium]|nr:MAG: replication-associated recombination protein A [Actinomycetota bacterium]